MAETPWLSIVGLGEDGPDGLPPASRAAIEAAEVVMGAKRHLALLPGLKAETIEWPVPFADGIPVVLALRGRRVVMLASGDPFWFGAGTSVAKHLEPEEWVAHPAPSTFALIAARLGWPLERTTCLGLHAALLTDIRPHLAPGQRIIALLRDGAAAQQLATRIFALGFGASHLTVCEAVGGPRERLRKMNAHSYDLDDVAHPVALAIEVEGDGRVLTRASGLPDDLFAHDGQITKRPVRALALSALAPRPGELLWDIGAGSGSIGIEWMLTHPTCRAIGIEADPARAERAETNAGVLGVGGLRIVRGTAPEALAGLPLPQAVFIGGGVTEQLLTHLWDILPEGTRVVAHAVTIESEALFAVWQEKAGGTLLRIELAEAAPLGRKRGWKASYPVVQWSVTR
ncbi:precorrin-6y C5,15-methyltransferase (decarboxylating) subunit CbiE [Tabrizicola sp. J26]|uniref:precorrin-6y C5,15-methyltransferase (decarboxylating) subunit CbiE n=1 Tax=Alitabrizicola rongguiensis TaxID=2909234 RepID=UPI001F2A1F67|nr:precorrin-6y C5,15-methyltransferase (decarboxylating) subunit CbiE [Tabrizicola rongguiensis]MCF1710204.1 precorrin-6y C5,15-methyltransferase (decarboxylating) subunit CbiE [Tabrizicola rongguiensis]